MKQLLALATLLLCAITAHATAQAESYSPYSSMEQRAVVIEGLQALNPRLPCDKGDYDSQMRIILPDDEITDDYSETRINVYLDKDGKFVKAYCG